MFKLIQSCFSKNISAKREEFFKKLDLAVKLGIYNLQFNGDGSLIGKLLTDISDKPLKDAFVEFFNTVTPFEVKADCPNIDVNKPIRDVAEAEANLLMFNNKYNGSFTTWLIKNNKLSDLTGETMNMEF